MVNNNVTFNENILVKVDQNNLIYIDPNSVVDENNNINPRGIYPENYVMYANLEADIIPRSILAARGEKSTLVSIAEGNVNFLKNSNGQDYDTNWTEAFTYKIKKEESLDNKNHNDKFLNNDKTGQSFGIDGIQVSIKGANSIPTVIINFIDVRGKTLFESPENSPYQAFFHIPWPIFYLTLKGYYGKAIKYRLHLVSLTTRYNDSSGNFDTTAKFVGSTFAFLNDIPLKAMMNCPYMYPNEVVEDGPSNQTQTAKKIYKSSRGYGILKNVYAEYKRKGLIDKNFPVKTLRELVVIAESLDKILEKQILDNVLDSKVFVGINELDKTLKDYRDSVKSWGRVNLANTSIVDNKKLYYDFKPADNVNFEKKIYGNSEGDLKYLLDKYTSELKKNTTFANEVVDDSKKKKLGGGDFKYEKLFTKPISNVSNYVNKNVNGIYRVAIESIITDINESIKVYSNQKEKLITQVEQEMNKIIINGGKKQEDKGFGFAPTIRNIFAVILANAEVYVRMLKEVHAVAFSKGKERASIIKDYSKESTDTPIYPWPEIKKNTADNKNKVIAYPADIDLIDKLNSNNTALWPEVDFVENYIEVATNKIDTNTDKEGTENTMRFIFDNDENYKTYYITTLDYVSNNFSYIDSTPASFLYEIWERACHYTLVDSFDTKILEELASLEFANIENSIKNNNELILLLKQKVYSVNDLINLLENYSPNERYPYFQDNIPTIPYIKNSFEISHTITEFQFNNKISILKNVKNINDYLKLYTPEIYRKDIYPFNSSTYLSYINANTSSLDELKLKDNLFVDTSNAFITSFFNSEAWIKKGYSVNNFFNYTLKVGDSSSSTQNNINVNILNTPYFHNQLLYDFNKSDIFGRYAGSSYLLLNSLPFIDLDDIINFSVDFYKFSDVRASSLFREIGASHYLPYHLICKWGSIYHRYKKFLLTGEDILEGCITSNNLTKSIDVNKFFNNNETGTTFTEYTVGTDTVKLNTDTTKQFIGDVSVHPFYDAVFHQVINDYNHYIVESGDTSFSANTISNSIIMRKRNPTNNKLNYWSSVVDNSKFDENQNYYTILPCDGNQKINVPLETNLSALQNYYKIIWDDKNYVSTYDNKKFFAYDEYNKTINNDYSLGANSKKVIDLIATFSPNILEEFEDIFLSFASQKINTPVNNDRFKNVSYYNFQDILKELTTIDKKLNSNYNLSDKIQLDKFFDEIKQQQNKKTKLTAEKIFGDNNLLLFTIGNPKELDKYVLYSFADVTTSNKLSTLSFNPYNTNNLTDTNKNYIKLYLGEDMDAHYVNFFIINNIELNEANILTLRPIIQIYAGYVQAGGNNSSENFKEYIRTQLINDVGDNKQKGAKERTNFFLSTLINKFPKLKFRERKTENIVSGYNSDVMKLELYNYFKSFNDKWASGNSLGQRLLFEEFLFLDKANKDIGDDLYINIDKLIQLGNTKNDKQNLYGVISMLISGTGVDMRPLPAYINFYTNKTKGKGKITPSKTIAQNLFGTFLEVDYQESSPKIILQLVGQTSKHPDILNKDYKYKDDSFYMGSTNQHPLIYSLPSNFSSENLFKSNRAVAFEVNFGDQNQAIFKGITLDQSSIKNTTESFVVLENIAKSESGAGAYNVDIGLFDYYRQASYTCDVTCMGNAMIQPTMFFYLNNVPMFKGSYWITEVTHTIKGNNFSTSFKGTRIPQDPLPDPKDSFVSSYRVLFDRLQNRIIAKINTDTNEATSTTKTIYANGTTYQTNISKLAKGEDWMKIRSDKSGLNNYNVPYNGYKGNDYTQLIKYEYNNEGEQEWLRASVVEMGGNNYKIEGNVTMSIASKVSNVVELKWSEVSGTSSTQLFYSMKFDTERPSPKIDANQIAKAITRFVNPENNKTITVKNFEITDNVNNRKVNGPIDIGPNNVSYGVGMSRKLMQELGLNDGDIVYFIMQ